MNVRTLQIRCTTWDQVETFYARKLRRGNILSVRVGFRPQPGEAITVALELPTGVVIAIEGEIKRANDDQASAAKQPRTWIEIELLGLTDTVLARLKQLVADGDDDAQLEIEMEAEAPPIVAQPPLPAPVEQSGLDAQLEREMFASLSAALRQYRAASVPELLGMGPEVNPAAVRSGWHALLARYHPDTVAKFHSSALTHLAEEITILANRAYDRVRARLVASGEGAAFGSSLGAPPHWLVEIEDVGGNRPKSNTGRRGVPRATREPKPQPVVTAVAVARPASEATGGESFEQRARGMLAQGEVENAREMLAMSLVVYPRSKPLRSLYYVAAALLSLRAEQNVLAISQLESALANDEHNKEVQELLAALDRNVAIDATFLAEVFGGGVGDGGGAG